jgi:crotonobetainyl-CoA:carnitine CoA-transferase CaiB-like acyl-CoA transferase
MVGHGDGMSGMTLAGGICAALFARDRTGEAPLVDGSLFGTALWFNTPAIMASRLESGGITPGIPDRSKAMPNSTDYRTKDGRYIKFVFLNDPQADWVDLCQRIGRPDLATDPRFATHEARVENQAEGLKTFDEIFAQRTLGEWKEALAEASGVWAPVQTPGETIDDVQTVANRFIQAVEYPNQTLHLAVPPVIFNEDAGDVAKAPDIGEHTDQVLTAAGFSADDLARLRRAGAIG